MDDLGMFKFIKQIRVNKAQERAKYERERAYLQEKIKANEANEKALKMRELAYLSDPKTIHVADVRRQSIEISARFLSRLTEEQVKRLIEAYTNQPHKREIDGIELPCSYYDPIEDDPAYRKKIEAARAEAQSVFSKSKLGDCLYIWSYMQRTLHELGIDWLSPTDLNPHIRYD